MTYNKEKQGYHLVESSPWPITVSCGIGIMGTGIVIWLGGLGLRVLKIGLVVTIMTAVGWWRDCIREGVMNGDHTEEVRRGLSLGFIIFIISEVLLFISIFWGYLHSALSPSQDLGGWWPPRGIESVNIWELPLVNTVLLLSSAVSVTIAHHGLMERSRVKVIVGLLTTIILATQFIGCQYIEYRDAAYGMSDGVVGSTFYIATGGHGLHVIVGTIFLIVGLCRVISYSIMQGNNPSIDLAIYYWHFVDLVWLALFIIIYWWGFA